MNPYIKFYNNLVSEYNNTPVIFKIRQGKKIIIKKPNKILDPLGRDPHFTPASQEWYNSVYSYNNHYLKTLPNADINLMNLLKSYLNARVKSKVIVRKRKYKSRKKNYKYKSSKQTFVGKGDLKHSNDKVLITLFIYNAENIYNKFFFKKWKKILFYPNKPYKISVNEFTYNNKKKEIVTRNRWHNMYEVMYSPITKIGHIKFLIKSLKRFNKYLIKYNQNIRFLSKFNTILNDEYKIKLLQDIPLFKVMDYSFNKYFQATPNRYILAKLNLYILLMNFNKLKHKYYNLCKFIPFIENIYRKKVIFNLINIRKRHLNSDIYTQIVSLKLKNRNNKLYRVLKLSLRGLRLPTVRRIRKLYQKPKSPYNILAQSIQNELIQPFINKFSTSLDRFLDIYLGKYKNIAYRKKRRSYTQKNSIIANIKHRKLRGIRLEAKGRLTRRRTAARSVFKMRYIGGLNNILSHIKGLPAIMLRGDRLSNVEHSIVNTNGRNGAFGIKGWVSSRTKRKYI